MKQSSEVPSPRLTLAAASWHAPVWLEETRNGLGKGAYAATGVQCEAGRGHQGAASRLPPTASGRAGVLGCEPDLVVAR